MTALHTAATAAKARERVTQDRLISITGTVVLHHRTGILDPTLLDQLARAYDEYAQAVTDAHDAAMAEMRDTRETLARLDTRGLDLAAVER